MTWPTSLTVAPLREWPGTLRPASARKRSQFQAGLTSTLQLLEHELHALHARDVELLVAISPDQFRLDGRPRATARAEHPGVVLSFDVPQVGHLAYPCDTYDLWQDNLRAIALALEALRRVDRYGVTSNAEQYRGFLALDAGSPVLSDVDRAVAWLHGYTGRPLDDPLDVVLRHAKRRAHPDSGGDPADFQRTLDAERTLREAGRL